MTGGVAWNTQPPLPLVCWSRKKPLLLATGNKTTNVLFKGTTACVTACQLADEGFVAAINCQFTKVVGHENRKVAGGTRDNESVGDAAWAAHAMADTHNER